ncbi:MAG: porin [Phenylobacterium sp.]|uniref:porin n=1 Tax=Phenylobacterium sp. TaxID=1871053 RepID=UPI001A5517F2|nr:porin [Phenylobacterium sp.]MBL8772267.1 porin [Phenylobacterium sp.]
MTPLSTRGAAAAACAGLLLCAASGPAIAAPASATEAKLQAMQRQLDDMRAQLDQLRAGGTTDPRLTAIQQQLDAMATQLAEMKTGQETAATDIATLKLPPAANAVTASLSNGKPALATTDGRFTANIRAILMMDGGKYFQDDNLPATVTSRDLNEGVNFRRARIGFDGRLFGDFDYAFVYEFGGSGVEEAGRLYEASVTYTALKPFRLKVGAFEPNVNLAAATSTSQMPLLERPAPAEAARNVAAGDSRVAIQLSANDAFGSETGVAWRWFAATAFTGNTLGGAQQFDEQTGWLARAALAPYSGVDWQAHIGANVQYVLQPNDATGPNGAGPRYPVQIRDRPELRLDGTRLVDTGAIDAEGARVFGGEAALQIKGLLVEAEAFRYRIERRASALPDPRFKGWYVQGSWVLTGETRPYNATEARFDAPKQTYTFNPAAGTWGAFELAARYSVLDLNFREGVAGAVGPLGAVRGGEQKILSFGANWYLNPAIRLMLDYQRVDIERLTAAGAQAGQAYDAVAARAQVTF